MELRIIDNDGGVNITFSDRGMHMNKVPTPEIVENQIIFLKNKLEALQGFRLGLIATNKPN